MPAESSPVRASDADREQVAAILRGAAGQGLLSLDEVGERLAAVHAATHLADLAPLTADLPDSGRRLAPVDPRVRTRARVLARVQVAGYVGVVGLLVGIWALTGAGYFWPVWPALGMLPAVLSPLAASRWAGDPSRARPARAPGGCRARAVQDSRQHRLAA